MTAKPRVKCEECGASCKRLIGSGAGIIFKGSGFYETDYKNKGKPETKDSESSSESKNADTSKDTAKKTDSTTQSSSSDSSKSSDGKKAVSSSEKT